MHRVRVVISPSSVWREQSLHVPSQQLFQPRRRRFRPYQVTTKSLDITFSAPTQYPLPETAELMPVSLSLQPYRLPSTTRDHDRGPVFAGLHFSSLLLTLSFPLTCPYGQYKLDMGLNDLEQDMGEATFCMCEPRGKLRDRSAMSRSSDRGDKRCVSALIFLHLILLPPASVCFYAAPVTATGSVHFNHN